MLMILSSLSTAITPSSMLERTASSSFRCFVILRIRSWISTAIWFMVSERLPISSGFSTGSLLSNSPRAKLSAPFLISSMGRLMRRETHRLRIAANKAMRRPPTTISISMLLRASSMEVKGTEVRRTPMMFESSFNGIPTYIMSFPRVRLYLVEIPTPPLRASLISGRSTWLSIVAGSFSESPMTSPSGRTTVTRVAGCSPILLHN